MKKYQFVMFVIIAIFMTLFFCGCAKKMELIEDEEYEDKTTKVIVATSKKQNLVNIKKYGEEETEEIVEDVEYEMTDDYQKEENTVIPTMEKMFVEETEEEILEEENIKSTLEGKEREFTFANLEEEKLEDCIERHLTVEEALEQDYFLYGKTPCRWVYVAPNKQIISNYKPKSSQIYAINKNVTSGKKGCFLPIFCKTENVTEDYEARFFCFDDVKDDASNYKFSNKLKDIEYRGLTIDTILKKGGYVYEEMQNGLLKMENGQYLNILFVETIDNILGIE